MLFRLEMAAFCARQTPNDKWVAADPDPPCAACTDSRDEPSTLQIMTPYALQGSTLRTNIPETPSELPRRR